MQFLKLCDQKPRIDSKFDAVSCETHDASNSVYSRIEPISSPTHDPITMSRISFQQPDGGSFERSTSSDDLTTSLKLLLDQEDNRGQKSKSALRCKMQRIGRTSKTALTKKILRRKSRDDSELARITHSLADSLNELSVRYSPTSMMRNSVSDIGVVLKKKMSGGGGADKLKFERSSSEGAGMAALLVSSMMAAQPSLRCIEEHHDAAADVGAPSMPSKDSLIVPSPYPSSMLIKESISNLSAYSMSSISISSGDEESDGEVGKSLMRKVEPETVSMVVNKVRARERERTRSYSNDDLDAMIAMAPSATFAPHHSGHVVGQHASFHIVRPKPTDKELAKFLTASADQDPDAENWIQPGSTVDEPELTADERDSKFHDLKENIIGTMHTLQDHMHMPTTNEFFHHADDHHHLNDAFQNMLQGQVALVANANPPLGQQAQHMHKSFRNRLTSFCKRFRASTSTGNVTAKAELIQTARKHPLIDIPKYDPIPTIKMSHSVSDAKIDQQFYGINSYGSALELSSAKEVTIRAFVSMPDLSHDLHQLVDLSGLNSIDSLRAGLTSTTVAQRSCVPSTDTNTSTTAKPILTATTTTTTTTTAFKSNPKKAIEKCAKNHAAISTNTPSLLAPLPQFPHRVFEKVPSGTANAAPSSTVTAGIKSMSIGQPATKKDPGHVRAESSGCKLPQHSPLRGSGAANHMTTSMGSSSGVATKEKDSVCRRSSDSDLSVTPKGMLIDTKLINAFK